MTWGKDWGVPECSQTKCWSTKKMYSIKVFIGLQQVQHIKRI